MKIQDRDSASFMFVSTSYLMAGILAECCNDRMLSDSIIEKKGAISGYISTERTVCTERMREMGQKHIHKQSAHSLIYSTIYSMFNKRVFSQVHKSYKSCFIPLRLIVY